MPSDVLANFISATVVLGLMPTLLSTIAPSIAEMALLSAHRPALSFLIALGAPSIWPTKLIEYNDPTRYVLVAGAVFNIVWTSLELGRNSILSWGCTTTFGPLLWTSLAGVVHLVAAFSFAYARSSAHSRQESANKGIRNWNATKGFRKIIGLLGKEFTLCAEQSLGQYDGNNAVPPLEVVANVLAGCGGFIYLMFGIIIF
ncbi:hypothetical protein COCCADRAFT_30949 [Bipolaris zeicola 26-R-13]|uniref:Uncharacterized protein n=1 Tax=Cochliobolus carbonum (strain 26-R-13) TaxID=930089 RepID=W6XPX1_COCC2|nr:uncharacterized protein COCCADRAFT_30949 [Bipolaris zeicola 26-R-13]EUC27603.1 hypothetical protein COCCADRAFT_30949 [Bipolaris zeicola 26-R-13]